MLVADRGGWQGVVGWGVGLVGGVKACILFRDARGGGGGRLGGVWWGGIFLGGSWFGVWGQGLVARQNRQR